MVTQGKGSTEDVVAEPAVRQVDTKKIREMLSRQKGKMKLLLSFCVHCGLCAESCFLYAGRGKDPKYIPAYKAINSLGRLYRQKGNIERALLEEIREVIWRHCVLCMRCYCPLGIDIPSMIALARSICRSQGVYGVYPHSIGAPYEQNEASVTVE
jgi:Fe-S oxidoreductase